MTKVTSASVVSADAAHLGQEWCDVLAAGASGCDGWLLCPPLMGGKVVKGVHSWRNVITKQVK